MRVLKFKAKNVKMEKQSELEETVTILIHQPEIGQMGKKKMVMICESGCSGRIFEETKFLDYTI